MFGPSSARRPRMFYMIIKFSSWALSARLARDEVFIIGLINSDITMYYATGLFQLNPKGRHII